MSENERAVVVQRFRERRAPAGPLSIRSHVPFEEGIERPCVWCEEPTDVLAETPFRPDLGRVPLHLVCGSEVMAAYRAWSEDDIATIKTLLLVLRLEALALGPGGGS